jgi:hypothetical protein
VAGIRAWLESLVHPRIGLVLGVFSAVAFVVTALVVPVVLARLPKDYFVRELPARRHHPVLRVLKNVLGVVLVLIGIAMLVLPGQGILTIVLGLGLVDFPGRRRFEIAVIRRPNVSKSINALRRKMGREPLELPPDDEQASQHAK